MGTQLRYIILLFLSGTVLFAGAQPQVFPITPVNAVGQVLIGGGINTSAVQYTGTNNAVARFTGASGSIGIAEGIVLSTGNLSTSVNALIGPSSNFISASNGTPGDALLSNISGVNTNDAAILQFQFVPLGDTLSFEYVFGSEEYNDYVNGGVNDVFAFLLSGPNPAGGTYNNFNLALIPGSATPISINTVNNGNAFGCSSGPCSNCTYFVDYCNGTQIACDAFTSVMRAIAPVVPCSTYTIRLGIADGGDSVFDSWVFLKANSFQTPQIIMNSQANIGGVDSILYEGCSNAMLKIKRTYDTTLAHTYTLQVSGTAQDGIDYSGLPQTLTFAPGQTQDSVLITTLFNGSSQQNTTLTVTISDTVCTNGGVISSSVTLQIINVNPLALDAGPDLLTCDTISIYPQITGGVQPYQYSWNNGISTMPYVSNLVITSDMVFALTVTDLCGTQVTDIVNANLIDPPTVGFGMSVFPAGATLINESCGQAAVIVSRQNFTSEFRQYALQTGGTAQSGVDYSPLLPVIFQPGQLSDTVYITPIYDALNEPDETIVLSLTDTLCDGSFVYDSLTLRIRNIIPLTLSTGPDLKTGCPITPVQLIANVANGNTPYNYLWSNGLNTATQNVSPSDTTQYTLTVTDSCGRTISDSIIVNVIFPPIPLFVFTSEDFCEPSQVKFEDRSQPGSGVISTYLWDMGNGVQQTISNPVQVYLQDAIYQVGLTIVNSENCTSSVTLPVVIHPKPTANFIWNPEDPTILFPEISLKDLSSPDVIGRTWSIEPEGYFSTSVNPQYTFTEPGLFPVTLEVVNDFGCRDTVTLNIPVKEDVSIYIPSSFTPDNNGNNEEFKVYGKNIDSMEMRIFDRWGEQLFVSKDINIGWSGRDSKGQALKSDSYVYKISIRDIYGGEHNYTGYLILLSVK